MSGQTWGYFRIRIKGKKKWSMLAPKRVMYFGRGYDLTKEEAFENAKLELNEAMVRFPGRIVDIYTYETGADYV